MTFAGIVACQIGTAMASAPSGRPCVRSASPRTRSSSGGILFEIVIAAAIIYLPPLQPIFHTAPLGAFELALLAPFPFIVWGCDELWRAWRRRQTGAVAIAK